MRILFLTQWWQPEPFFKGLPFAKELQRRGHEVEVLTGFPNYPGGRLYPGYKLRWSQTEIMEGVTVHRSFLYPSHSRSSLNRLLNYLSFAVSVRVLAPFVVREPPDIIYVYNLVTLGPVAIALRRWYHSKIVYDIQDIWPESVIHSGMLGGKVVYKLIDGWCRWLYKQADRIVVLSPGFKALLEQRGVAPEKLKVIYNWFDAENPGQTLPIQPRPDTFAKDRFNIVFAGTIGQSQAMDTVLDAAVGLQVSKPSIHFFLIGAGTEVERLKQVASQRGIRNITFVPTVPRHEIGAYLEAADALLVHLRDEPIFSITVPSKTQAYLAAGRPILMGVRGDAANLVKEAEAGLAFEPENAASLTNAILALYAMPSAERHRMGASGRRYYEQHLRMELAVDQFETLFHSLSNRPDHRPS